MKTSSRPGRPITEPIAAAVQDHASGAVALSSRSRGKTSVAEEAADIVHSELSMARSQRKTQKLISNPRSQTCAIVAGTAMSRPGGLFLGDTRVGTLATVAPPAYVNVGGMLWPALARVFCHVVPTDVPAIPNRRTVNQPNREDAL